MNQMVMETATPAGRAANVEFVLEYLVAFGGDAELTTAPADLLHPADAGYDPHRRSNVRAAFDARHPAKAAA